MGSGVFRPATLALNFLILVFSVSFFYFAFVYYPKAAETARFENPIKNLFKEKVVVSADHFPIVADGFRVTYESESSLYYVFVGGSTISEYVENKASAQFALKNALQSETLCDYKVIYSSTKLEDLADEYKVTTGC